MAARANHCDENVGRKNDDDKGGNHGAHDPLIEALVIHARPRHCKCERMVSGVELVWQLRAFENFVAVGEFSPILLAIASHP